MTSITLPQTSEERLEFSQSIRHQLAQELMKDGKIPDSADDRELLLKTIEHMDRTTLGAMKIQTDDKRAARDQLVAAALVDLSQKIGSAKLFRKEGAEREPITIPADALPDVDLVEGELSTSQENLNYKEFEQRMRREAGASRLPAPDPD